MMSFLTGTNYINWMKYRYLLTLTLFAFYIGTKAQVSVVGIPASFNNRLNTRLSKVIIPNNIPPTLLIDKKNPTQAGYTLPFNYKLTEVGSWEQINDNFIWRLEIIVPNANSINLYFDSINLSSGEKLYLYNKNKTRTLGAFTNNNNGLYMCTDFIYNSHIIIEFNTHKKYKLLPFSVHEIGVLLNDGQYNLRSFGDAGSCEVHINCAEGKNWQNEKDGVVRILLKQGNSTFWCTGSLINNTLHDATPYFLTANHCGEYADSSDYAQWLFYFNFQSEDCNQPLVEPAFSTVSGSQMLAHAPSGTSSGSDFKLLLLNDNIPINYYPFFNGWDVSGNASPSGVTIHHPQGDLKMISTYTSALVSANYNEQTYDPNGKYWMVHWIETENGHGVTEGGSSGSPIFNSNGYIVGALTGGFASCTNLNAPDYYGKLSYSWSSNGTDSTSRLDYWLDPTASGVTHLKGINLDSTSIFAGFVGEPITIIIGGTVSFVNTSLGNIVSYQWHFSGGTPEYSKEKEPGNVKYNKVGEYDVRLIVSSEKGKDTLLIKNYIKVLPSISPNPSNGKFKLAFGDKLPEDIVNNIRIFNAIGVETNFRILKNGDNYLIVDILSKTKGLYLIKISAPHINNTFKVIVIP